MVISAEARARIDAEIQKYPRKRGALLPALHIVQGELGHVGAETARELAEIFEILPDRGDGGGLVLQHVLRDAAAAPPRLRVHQPALLAARRAPLLHELEQHLNVDDAGNTADGRIHLGHEECLGACAYAPMLRVDAIYHEDLDVAKAKALVDALA